MSNQTYEITISGRVQGVGFRPFIYNLAKKQNIKGFVTNFENGVFILAHAEDKVIDEFYEQILSQKPISAQIISSQINKIPILVLLNDFIIKPTESNLLINIPLTPDFAICKSCSNEILDPKKFKILLSIHDLYTMWTKIYYYQKVPFRKGKQQY